MAKTVASNSSSYCTAAEFLKRFDARTVGDLCSDDGTRITEANLPTNAKLQAVLDDASGMVESAALKGERYDAADLAALTGVAKAMLNRIVADIAMAYLVERRPDLKKELPAGLERSMAWLEELAQGNRIFGFTETAEAGRIDHEITTPEDVTDRRGLVVHAERYFGQRTDRMR